MFNKYIAYLIGGGTPQRDFRKEVRGGNLSISDKEVWYG